MSNQIDITNCDLRAFVRAVYKHSIAQGLGFLHFQDGELSDSDIDEILGRADKRVRLSMDYVHGRACKMTVYQGEDNTLFIRDSWYDHSQRQLVALLDECGIKVV